MCDAKECKGFADVGEREENEKEEEEEEEEEGGAGRARGCEATGRGLLLPLLLPLLRERLRT